MTAMRPFGTRTPGSSPNSMPSTQTRRASPQRRIGPGQRTAGRTPRAHRYPMGKGAKPLCSLWEGRRLGYIEARKKIYAPLYARAVVKTRAYAELRELLRTTSQDIYLRDWDGYDHLVKNLTISEVANNPRKKMGHAFVLWALIEGQYEQLVADTPQPTQFNF